MKTFYSAVIFAFLFSFSAQSQVVPPQAFNYSAVARDADGEPLANQSIGIQISVLEGDDETLVYQETHVAETDEFGLLNLGIGNGTIQQGDMSSIAWGENNYYLEVRMDVNGGDDFGEDPVGEPTQLLSVPYALYAKSAGSLDSEEEELYIGMEYQGGVIFHLYKDDNGDQHGLILSLEDLGPGQSQWGYEGVLTNANSWWDGESNTNAITQVDILGETAAGLCYNYELSGFDDWYLPSIYELRLIASNYVDLNRALSNIPDTDIIGPNSFWTSSEAGANNARYFHFDDASIQSQSKSGFGRVRAVRAF